MSRLRPRLWCAGLGLVVVGDRDDHCSVHTTDRDAASPTQDDHERLVVLGQRVANNGSGHAMLGALRRLRFDFVVIDGRTMDAALEDPELGALGGAVCSLAGALGARVVGRGLSTRSQAERLAHLGCELASGAPWPRDLSLDELARRWTG